MNHFDNGFKPELPECRTVPAPQGAGGVVEFDVYGVGFNSGLVGDCSAKGLAELFCLFGS